MITSWLCQLEALNAWHGTRKRSEMFPKIIQGPIEAFTDFLLLLLQRSTSAVNRRVSDLEARQIFIRSLALENANSECKGGD